MVQCNESQGKTIGCEAECRVRKHEYVSKIMKVGKVWKNNYESGNLHGKMVCGCEKGRF